MSRHLPVRTVLAGVALIVLAGCGASGHDATPQVSMGVGKVAGKAASKAHDAGSGTSATSNSYVAPSSIPFPAAVGNTWVYQTTTSASASGETGRTTDKIVSAGATTTGYQVTMSETIAVAGSAIYAEPTYVFYPDGTVGFPVAHANGVSVEGNGVTWPDAASLASGQAYHSTATLLVDQGGISEYQSADVTVRGSGTAAVTVPAGTYQALVVDTTITTKVGRVTTTELIRTWLAANAGPVKSEVVTQTGGKTEQTTTNVLLSFRGAAPADGS